MQIKKASLFFLTLSLISCFFLFLSQSQSQNLTNLDEEYQNEEDYEILSQETKIQIKENEDRKIIAQIEETYLVKGILRNLVKTYPNQKLLEQLQNQNQNENENHKEKFINYLNQIEEFKVLLNEQELVVMKKGFLDENQELNFFEFKLNDNNRSKNYELNITYNIELTKDHILYERYTLNYPVLDLLEGKLKENQTALIFPTTVRGDLLLSDNLSELNRKKNRFSIRKRQNRSSLLLNLDLINSNRNSNLNNFPESNLSLDLIEVKFHNPILVKEVRDIDSAIKKRKDVYNNLLGLLVRVDKLAGDGIYSFQDLYYLEKKDETALELLDVALRYRDFETFDEVMKVYFPCYVKTEFNQAENEIEVIGWNYFSKVNEEIDLMGTDQEKSLWNSCNKVWVKKIKTAKDSDIDTATAPVDSDSNNLSDNQPDYQISYNKGTEEVINTAYRVIQRIDPEDVRATEMEKLMDNLETIKSYVEKNKAMLRDLEANQDSLNLNNQNFELTGDNSSPDNNQVLLNKIELKYIILGLIVLVSIIVVLSGIALLRVR
jgi:hypothetical protein